MAQKALLVVFILFYVASSGMFAQKVNTVEFVLSSQCVGENSYIPTDHTQLESFEIPSFHTFHVPASRNSDILFMQHWTQVLFKWSNFETRIIRANINFRIISSIIPSDIEVISINNVVSIGETNFAGNYDLYWRRSRRTRKGMMYRDILEWWRVRYTATEEDVAEHEALLIINNLMDNGFDVEVFVRGEMQGSYGFIVVGPGIEITRTKWTDQY